MSRFHALKIAEIARPTADSVAIGFAIPEDLKQAFAFAPGQYLTLRAEIDGEDLRRSYSICSRADDSLLRIGVKKVEGGAFSAFANENLKPGDIVEVMPPERVRFELFTASAPRARFKAPETMVAAEVVARLDITIDGKRNGVDMLATDENVIDAAARAGLELPYSCKGGMCSTCRCKVTQGAVEMAVNYSLEGWETDAGFVLACQARPTTPNVSLDFDQM